MPLFKCLMRQISHFSVIALCLAAAACSPAVNTRPESPQSQQSGSWSGNLYKLASGDQVNIQVFGEDNLSGEYRVETDGTLNFPLIGRISAVGNSTTEFEKLLKRKLSQGYLVDPQVTTQVLSYRSIYVEGEVNKQGEYPFSPGLTVQQIVTLAGGLTRFAAEKYYVQRRGQGPDTKMRVSPDAFVYPGDLVSVGERLF